MSIFAVNGASGWLGKTTLNVLQDLRIDPSGILAISSSSQTVSVNTETYKCANQNDLLTGSKIELFVHTAFITREHYQKLGEKLYVELNTEIIEQTIRALEKSPPKSIVFISSGICKDHRILQSRDRSYEVYRNLKTIEAERFREFAANNNTVLVEGMLFSATGKHMNSPTSYAIGNIINQALRGDVELSSSSLVYRRYCDAGQFMGLLVEYALDGRAVQIESGGILQEMHELAANCLDFLGLEREIFRSGKFSEGALEDHYYSEFNTFENSLAELGESPFPIIEQIANVYFAIQRNLRT